MSVPTWLQPLLAAVDDIDGEPSPEPPGEGRSSAVLILFGSGTAGPDLLLMQRADELRSHPGQPAFPGGAADPGDDSPPRTALREAAEEVGVIASGVTILAELPRLQLQHSGFVVTPVLGWWHEPSQVAVVDPAETASVVRVPIAELVDPANRFRARHPSGFLGPAFAVRGMLVWGFTAGLLDNVLTLGGWTVPWDRSDVRPLPDRVVQLSARQPPPAGNVPGVHPISAPRGRR